MSSSKDLERMIAQIALGSRADFQRLYESTSAKLFGICLRILGNQVDAEEVLQESYIKVWKSADRFAAGRASPISWLAAIARNSAIDRIRSKKPTSGDMSEVEMMADEAPSPEANAILANETSRLRDCLDELDARHSLAVKQVYLNGWTYAEAAGEFDIPLNTMKTWIRRSLISLRECLNR